MQYVTMLLYPEHFNSFDDMCKSINELDIPCLLSPLHPAESKGKKDHYHIIFDNTENDFDDSYFDTIKEKFNSPDWRKVNSIKRMELYLTHSTIDSAHKKQFSKSDKEVSNYD